MYKISLSIILSIISFSLSHSQSSLASFIENYQIKTNIQFQLWGTHSFHNEVYNSESGTYETVDNRTDMMIRRGRVGFQAKPYKNVSLNIKTAFDVIGHDALSSTVGNFNPPTPNLSLWDAFVQWKVSDRNESVYLTAGYFRPLINRENLTSAFQVNSMEKSWSQNYFRNHLVGTGPGRTTGINIGGLFLGEKKLGFGYNLGVFFPLTTNPSSQLKGFTRGNTTSPLMVGQLEMQIGDPELTTYKLGRKFNFLSKRKGLTLGIGGAHQGETELFAQNQIVNVDILFNYGPFNLGGDWNWLFRKGERQLETQMREFSYAAQTGCLRAGYNFVLGEKYFLELAGMAMHYEGGKTSTEQADAAAINAFSGDHSTFDIGLNWYIHQHNLKLMLHYTWNEGDAGAATGSPTVNHFFRQRNIGAIRRGDWVGVGLIAVM